MWEQLFEMGYGGTEGVGALFLGRAAEIGRCATAAISERTMETKRVKKPLSLLTSPHPINHLRGRQTGTLSHSFATATEGSMSLSRNQQNQSPGANDGD